MYEKHPKDAILITNDSVDRLTIFNDEENKIVKPYMKLESIPRSRFIKNFKKFNTGKYLLPRNCRYLDSRDGSFIMIIEHSPIMRTIKISSEILSEEYDSLTKNHMGSYISKESMQSSKVSIYLPYVIYTIKITENCLDLYIAFKLNTLNNLNEYLILPNLLNVSTDGHVCLGDFGPEDMRSDFDSLNFDVIARKTIDRFWTAQFNAEIRALYDEYSSDSPDSHIKYFLKWQHFSKVDPMFIFSEPWLINSYRLSEHMEDYLCTDGENLVARMHSYFYKNNDRNSDDDDDYEYETRDDYRLNNTILATNGDEIKIDNENYMIDYFYYSDCIWYTRLSHIDTDEDKVLLMDEHNKNLLIESLTRSNNFFDRIEIDGTCIESGKLYIREKINTEYVSEKMSLFNYNYVEAIRKNRLGEYEIKVGNNYHLATKDFIDTIRDFSLDVFDSLLKKDLIISNTNTSPRVFCETKLDEVSFDKKQELIIFKTVCVDNKENKVIHFVKNYINDESSICFAPTEPFMKHKEAHAAIKQMNYLYISDKNQTFYHDDKSGEILVKVNDIRYIENRDTMPYQNLSILFDDDNNLTRIFNRNSDLIKSRLCVGDLIIIKSQIINSYEINIKVIKRIYIMDSTIMVEAIGESETPEVYKYISHKRSYICNHNATINQTEIRRVSLEYEDIKVGDKVKVKGVYNDVDFEEGSVYEVKAILIDTDEPYILFSNISCISVKEFTSKDCFEIIHKDDPKYDDDEKEITTEIASNMNIFPSTF